MAPKLEVVETLKLVAEVIAASKLSAPVIAMAPKPPFAAPPTMPLNSTSLLPTLMVRALPSEASEFTVPLMVILLLVVVRLMAEVISVLAPKVMVVVVVSAPARLIADTVDAVRLPVIESDCPTLLEPMVRLPVLLKVVLLVMLDAPLCARVMSNASLGVFKVVIFKAPLKLNEPVWVPSVKPPPPSEVMVA